MRPPGREKIHAAVQRRRDEILHWTEQLLRFPSENRPPGGAEAGAQEFLAKECRKLGWTVESYLPTDVHAAVSHQYWLPGRDYPPGRCNIAAKWKGTGGGKSLLFSGHADVAPFEPDNWTVCRPYEPRIVEGRLYGRGSADMKGGLAAAYWALRVLAEEGFSPAGDLLYESIVDEEYAGGNGTLAGRLKGFNADLAILSEPTRMQVCPACLGAFLGDISIRGKAGMPYMGTAIPNPVFAAARVIDLFKEWEKSWRSRNSHPLFREPGKELNVVLSSISSAVPGEFTQMGIPLVALISWIVWCYPGLSDEDFYGMFRSFWEERFTSDPALTPFVIELTPTYHTVRAWETPVADPGVAAVVDAFTEVTGAAPVVGGAPFSCDLGLYGDPGGMPCLVLGPRGDNLHAPDEWVLVDDILSLAEIFACTAVRWSGTT